MRRTALLAACLAPLLALSAVAQRTDGDPSLAARLARVTSDEADAELARSLLPLAPETLAEMLALVEAAEGGEPLGAGQRATLRLALESSFAEHVVEFLDRKTRESNEPSGAGGARASAALWMLHHAVHPDGAPVLARLANRDPQSHARAFHGAMSRLLARHPRAAEPILRRLEAPLHVPLARSLGDAGDPQSLPSLVGLLQRTPELDAAALTSIARIATRHAGPFSERILGAVRPYLYRGEGAVLLAAIEALGALEDRESVPGLLPLLESPHPRTLGAAHRALKSISAQRFLARSADWISWYRQEERWWEEAAPVQLAALERGGRSEITSALRELTRHPLYRHEIAPAVAALLDADGPVVGEIACAVLGQLGSAAAQPALESALHDPDLAPHARSALAQLSPGTPPATRP